jgi:hypothetical protein
MAQDCLSEAPPFAALFVMYCYMSTRRSEDVVGPPAQLISHENAGFDPFLGGVKDAILLHEMGI